MKKLLTSAVALLICTVLLFSFASCHKQGARVAEAEGEEITSGLYLVFLVNADMEARDLVAQQHSEDEDFDSATADYYSMKVEITDEDASSEETSSEETSSEDVSSEETSSEEEVETVDFKTYVRQQAEKMMQQYIYIGKLAKEKEIELSDEDKEESESYASYYWAYYGYQTIFEPNGVSFESYKTYFERQQLSYKIFEKMYEVGGEKGVTEKALKAALSENYAIANAITVTLANTDEEGNTTDFTDDEKKEAKEKLTDYAKKINKGEMTFKEVYEIYNGEIEETETDSEEAQPKDTLATVFGNQKTSATTNFYEDVAELIEKDKVGKASVVEDENLNQYALLIPGDITADSYYYDTYLADITSILYSEEYEQMLETKAEDIELDINSYELNYLNPKKIVYETAQG